MAADGLLSLAEVVDLYDRPGAGRIARVHYTFTDNTGVDRYVVVLRHGPYSTVEVHTYEWARTLL